MKCWYCDKEVYWVHDYTFKDFGIDGDGMVTVLECSNHECNAEHEVKIKN